MSVWFVREGNRGVAYFRANDEAEDVFIAAIALDVYDSETEAQDRFAALVHVAADFFRRKYAAEAIAPASRLDGYPCDMRNVGGTGSQISCRTAFECWRNSAEPWWVAVGLLQNNSGWRVQKPFGLVTT